MTDYESETVQNTRYFPDDYYSMSQIIRAVLSLGFKMSCIIRRNTIYAYFKDSNDNRFYQATAGLDEFMVLGDAALTFKEVKNGQGESEIIARAARIKASEPVLLNGVLTSFFEGKIKIDFPFPLNKYVDIPIFSVTGDDSVSVSSVALSNDRRSLFLTLSNQGAESVSTFEIASLGSIYLENDTTRYQIESQTQLIDTRLIETPRPTFISQRDFVVEQGNNSVAVVFSELANDDNQYVIANGFDGDLFIIDQNTGMLKLLSALNYDSNSNNIDANQYTVVVQVLSNSGEFVAERAFTINIIEANLKITGTVVDSYVAGALVFQDLNNNGVADASEPQTLTDVEGNYELTLSSTDRNARVRVVNTGFDIGANEVLGAMLDTFPSGQENYVMTPVSTLMGRMLGLDYGLTAETANQRVASVLDLNLVDMPNASLLGFDPIDLMVNGETSDVQTAKAYFQKQMELMTLGNLTGAYFKYNTNQVLANNAQLDDDYLAALGHEQFFDSLAQVLTAKVALPDAFILSDYPLELVDYIDGKMSNSHFLYPSVNENTITLDQNKVKLDLSNLQNIVSSENTGKVPALNIYLDNIPHAGRSGQLTIVTKLYDGTDSSRDDGERIITAEALFEWESNGSEITLIAPVQQVPVSFIDGSGVGIQRDFANQTADVLLFKRADDVLPASLELRVTSYIANNLARVGLNPEAYFGAGDYFLEIEIGNSPLFDKQGAELSSISLPFTLSDEHIVASFIDDGLVAEEDSMATVRLSQARLTDTVLSYQIEPLQIEPTQFSALTGQVVIPAGQKVHQFALPIINNNETDAVGYFRVTVGSTDPSVDTTKSVASLLLFDLENVLFPSENGTLENVLTQNLSNTLEAIVISQFGSVVEQEQNDKWPILFNVFSAEIASRIEDISPDGDEISDFATRLTVLVTAIRYIDFAELEAYFVDGSLIISTNDFAIIVADELDKTIELAKQTVTDPFGLETSAQFPDANIVILSQENDDFVGTNASELIATRNGLDFVNGQGGNDKLIGGFDVDTLSGGEGDDHVYGQAANDMLYGDAGDDKIVGGLGDDIINGGPGDDLLLGQAGDDQFITGSGQDEAYGSIGDDTFIVDGLGNKLIDGGPGNDTLAINVSGITDITDLQTSADGDYTVLSNADDSLVVRFKNIENFEINGVSFVKLSQGYNATDQANYVDPQQHVIQRDTILNGYGSITGAYVSSSDNLIMLYPFTESQGANLDLSRFTDWNSQINNLLNNSVPIQVIGTSLNDIVSFGIEQNNSLILDVDTKDGIDLVNLSGSYGADRVNLGAGNDYLYVSHAQDTVYDVMDMSSIIGTQISDSSYQLDIELDGGLGNDWLIIGTPYDASYGVTYELNTAPTQGFENIQGTKQDDTLTGDDVANIINAGSGSDKVYGLGGDDIIYGSYGSIDSGSNASDGNDLLFGGAGDDTLYGNAGDDELDGGLGRDILYGDSASNDDYYMPGMESEVQTGGADTFIVRAGDGGLNIDTADIIMDFEDGSDQIVLADGLIFSELTLYQGEDDYSSDVIIKHQDEYLIIVKNIQLSELNYFDILVNNGLPVNTSGTEQDDVLLGSSSNDELSTSTGIDVVVGYQGDDIVNVSGLGNKLIDGGPGNDTLAINVSGITDITDLQTSADGDYTVLSNADDSLVVRFKNIENFEINGVSFVKLSQGYNATDQANYVDPQQHVIQRDTILNGYGSITGAYVSSSDNLIMLYPFTESQGANLDLSRFTDWNSQINNLLNNSVPIQVIGTSLNDIVSFGIEQNNSLILDVDTKDGIDLVNLSGSYGADRVNLGAGNDYLYVSHAQDTVYDVMDMSSIIGTQISDSSYQLDIELDGGLGNDWLIIGTPYDASYGVTYELNTAPTQGFENIQGTKQDDTLTGDDVANIINAGSGSDKVYGLGGDDIIYGSYGSIDSGSNASDGNDLLFGGAGDDTLYGNDGDDELDGGLGRDILYGDSASNDDYYMPGMESEVQTGGADTFIVRAGDGGLNIDTADIIMDFEDGSDQIVLADGLIFSELTLYQGEDDYSSDVIIKHQDEYLIIVKNIQLSELNYFDILVNNGLPVNTSGTEQDDVLLGSSSNDELSTSTGIDVVVGYQGDDIVNVSGLGNKLIDGGPGNDTLAINVSGITDITDLQTSADGDYTVLSNADDSLVVRFKNIENFEINGVSFVKLSQGYNATDQANYVDPQQHVIQRDTILNGYGSITGAYVSSSDNLIMLYPFTESQGANLDLSRFTDWNSQINNLLNNSVPIQVIGTSLNDIVSFGIEQNNSLILDVDTKDGIDLVNLSGSYGADRVNLGAGNDYLYVSHAQDTVYDVMDMSSIIGTQISDSSYQLDIELDGGLGNDWLIIGTPYDASYGVTYELNTAPTQGFENIQGTKQDDTLTGDDVANIINAGSGSDKVYGLGGDDIIYGSYGSIDSGSNASDGNDLLFGGAGDDTLYGNDGDDELDGGLGRDILYGDSASNAAYYMPGMESEVQTGGSDLFVTHQAYASQCPNTADTIMDFVDGTDQIGLAGDIVYEQLSIEQGIESYRNDVFVMIDGKYLFVIKNIDREYINELDIISVESSQPTPEDIEPYDSGLVCEFTLPGDDSNDSSGSSGTLSIYDTSDTSNLEHNLLEYGVLSGWNLYGDNDKFGRMSDDSGYLTAYFEVEAGVPNIPNFGFTTDTFNGGDGSSLDFYEASNNGGELIFSMKVLSSLVPRFEVRFESSDGRVAVQGFNNNLDGLTPNSDWQEFRFDLGNFFDIDNANLVRITIAPDSAVEEMVQYQVAQLRTTSGNNNVSAGGLSYVDTGSSSNVQHNLLDNDLAPGWNLYGDNDKFGRMSDDSGYLTAYFEVEAGLPNIPNFGFTTDTFNGGDGSSLDFYEASNNGGELIFSMKVLSSLVPRFEVRFESSDGRVAVQGFENNLDGLTPNSDWQEFRFDLGNFFDIDNANLVRITIAPDSAVEEMVQYQVAQLRTTSGNNNVSAGGLSYVDTGSSSNVQHNLLDNDLAPGWNLYGDNDKFGRMSDDSGYLTAYFEVEAGLPNIPNFGFTTDTFNGGDGSSLDFYEASNNGGELIFSMKVLSSLVPRFEVRFESSDGRVAVQGFENNLDGLTPNSDWQEFRFDLGNFFDIDNANLVRITIAPDSAVEEMVQYQVAQLRTTSGNNNVSAGGLSYVDTGSSSNVQHNLLDNDLAPGWNLYGDNDKFGRMSDDSGYLTAYFEVEAGLPNIPNFGFTTDTFNGGDGSSLDFYEASNNGGELIFSMKVLSSLVPRFEVRFESSDGRVAVQGFENNLDGLTPNSDWQEFRFDLGNFFDIDNANLVRITIAPDSAVEEMVQYQVAQLRNTTGFDSGPTGPVDGGLLANMAPFVNTGAEVNGEQFIIRDHVNDWGGFANVNSDITDLSFPLGGEVNFDAALPSSDSLQTTVYFKFEYQPFPLVDPDFTTEKVIISNTDMQSFSIRIPPKDASNTYSSFLLYIEELEQPVVIQNIQVVVY